MTEPKPPTAAELARWERLLATAGPSHEADLALAAAARKHWPRCIAEVRRLREANRCLHDATIVLRNALPAHTEHWDKTGRHGAGCDACKRQMGARDEARALIEQAARAAGGEK